MAGFGGAVKLTGEAEYKRALKQITQNLKEITSEMKAVSSAYDKNDRSVTAVASQTEKLNSVQARQKQNLAALKAQYKTMSAEYDSQKAKHTALVNTYNQEKTKLDALERTLGKTSTEYKQQKSKVQELANAVKKSTTAQDANEKSLSQMRIAMNKAETEINQTSKAMRELKTSTESASGGFTILKGAIANIAADAFIRLTQGIKDFAVQTVQVGMDFEASMSKVQATSGSSAEEMEKLTEKAKELGKTTKFSASESAEAFNYMSMAGWKTEDMLNGIDGVMALAAASGADLATTSDIVTDALTAMGYSAGDAGHLADVMAAASSNANTNVEMMGATFKYAAPIVGALGYNMEDTAVAIGLMANAGIKGEQAGTALRSVLSRLSAPPAECAKAMEELGISIQNADGTMKPLNDVIDEMRTAFDGLGEAEKTEMAKKIAGTEAMSGLLAIVNAAPADYEKLTAAVNDSAGAAQEMSDIMMDNAQGDWITFKSHVEGVQIALYEKLEPAIRDVIDIMDKLLDAVDWCIEHGNEIMAVITGIGAALAVIGIGALVMQIVELGGVMATISTIAATLSGVLPAIGAAIAAIGGPITIVIALIAAVVAAVIYLWNTNEDFMNKVIEIWNNIKEFVGNAIDGIVTFFTETVPNGIKSMLQWFQDLPGKIAEFLANALTNIATWAAETGAKALEAGVTFLTNIVTFYQQLPYKIGLFLGTVLGNVIVWVANMAQKALEAGRNFLNNVVNFVSQLPGRMASFISNIISKVVKFASDMATKAKQAGRDFLNNVVNFVSQLPGRIATFISNIIGNLVTFVSNMGSKGAEAASSLFDNVVNGLASLPSSILSIGSDIVSGLWEGISGAAGWLYDKVAGFAGGILDGAKKALGINSPSRKFRDEVGRWLPEGIAVGFEKDMPHAIAEMKGTLNASVNDIANGINIEGGSLSSAMSYDSMVSAFKDALSEMKIELDGDDMGRFIDRTVTRLVYN